MRLSIDDHVRVCSTTATQAILGKLSITIAGAMQLRASFAAVAADPDARLRCAAQIGHQLVEADPALAAIIADAISARVGK